MIDHRALQRTLFRMQADEGFAQSVLAGESKAIATTGLSEEEIALLEPVELAALTADPGGKRRTQVVGNASSEFQLSLAVAARLPWADDFLEGFLTSSEFHRAMAQEGRLPLAFGEYAARRAEAHEELLLSAIVALELAMSKLRRRAQADDATERSELSPGEILLAPSVCIEDLPAGTTQLAARMRKELDVESAPSSDLVTLEPGREMVLLRANPPTSAHQLVDVSIELLQPPVDELLLRAREPFGREDRAQFARSKGADPQDLERFLVDYVTEGVLVLAG